MIRFEDFEREVVALCRILKPGGYLIIRHSNFRFSDTSAADDFEVALGIEPGRPGEATPLYGRDNRLLVGVVYHDAVFRKGKTG